MSALNKQYYNFDDYYSSNAYSKDNIFADMDSMFGDFYDESSIRVLRQPLNYDIIQEEVSTPAPKLKERVKLQVQTVEKEGNLLKLAKITLILTVLSLFMFVGVVLVTRYLSINELQYKNTSMRNAINDITRQKEMYIVAKANAISMENLEKFAIEELDMIKLDQGNTLIIEQAINSNITPNIDFME